ncbi:MAG: phosphoenolpyruvate--protein phosphotransferase [Synergistetes bacterium]|nr:phosphoenolpyruvate--protein phosphotransferase [Synergistota bacterium]
MVGIVIVSHSEKLAEGVVELAKQMTAGKDVPIKAAGGFDDGSLGTSYEKILDAINEAYTEDGVLILMDLGSAIMTTQMCLENLPEEKRKKIKLCNAPLVEGAVAAAAAAAQGLSLEEVKERAESVNLVKLQEEEVPPEEVPLKEGVKSVEIQLINPSGLHARPAALFVQVASQFKSKITVQNITSKKPPADAKSIMDMAVNGTAEKGEWIRIIAEGEDAEEALRALRELVESGFGELEEERGKTSDVVEEKEAVPEEGRFKGTPVYPGYVVAPILVYKRKTVKEGVGEKFSSDEELEKFREAIAKAINEIEDLKEKVSKNGDPKVAAIFDFHAMVLKDSKFISQIESLIKEGFSSREAVLKVVEEWASQLEKQGTTLMKERSSDLKDIGNRVLRILSGEDLSGISIEEKVILVADELLPSETASLDRNLVVGIATARGGTTSHAAILARMWGIPSIVGLGERILSLPDGTLVALNGFSGELIVNPSQELVEDFKTKEEARRKAESRLLVQAKELAFTLDKRRVEIVANVGNLDTVSEALDYGAEGIGLLRTEFLYVDRTEMPSEEEQYMAYLKVAEIMGDRLVVIRTLDVGGDKPLPYIPMEKEENPFLGVRAIRLQRLHPDLLKNQIKAILRAAVKGNLKFMLPMVAAVEEIRWVKGIVEECKEELRRKGVAFSDKVEMGIMVEIPSAAIMSDVLAKEVDFFSIGTNDLTQYTLACDRGNKNLNYLFDSLEPSILRLIKMTVDGAHAHGKWVGVCGEMAGEREAIPVLIGLGVDELSMNPRLIPQAKDMVRRFSYKELKSFAEEVLKLESAKEVRELVVKRCGL